MALQKAKYRVKAVELDCHQCGETIPAPNGSLFWTVEELAVAKEQHTIGQVCQSCKAVVGFPRIGHV